MTGPDIPAPIAAVTYPIRPLIAAIASISAVGMALGLGIPLLSILMQKQGYSGALIGANTAVAGIATLFTAPFATKIAQKMGLTHALLMGIIISGLSFFAFAFTQNIVAWFVLRAILHFGLALVFIYSEVWINSSAPDEKRGFIFGIYATVLSLGFALGPMIFALVGSDGLLPFIIGTAIILVAVIPVLMALADGPMLDEAPSTSFFRFIFVVPIATAAVFVFGAAETGGMALFPVYGMGNGFTEERAALLMAMFGLGNVFLQIPLGTLSDRVADRRHLLVACGIVGVVGMLMLPLMATQWWAVAAIMFFWGGAVAGLYTVGLAHLGSRLKGTDLAAANSAFVFCYALGMLIGPPVMGASIDRFGYDGFPLSLAAFFLVYVIFVLMRLIRR